MAKRYYTKTAQYILPAWKMFAFHIDGIYVDGYLFDQNIPLLDAKMSITVTPQNWHTFFHEILLRMPKFQGGVVDFLQAHLWWWPGQQHIQNHTMYSSGYPYGMGINGIGVACYLGGIITRDIVYDVSYVMEVDV